MESDDGYLWKQEGSGPDLLERTAFASAPYFSYDPRTNSLVVAPFAPFAQSFRDDDGRDLLTYGLLEHLGIGGQKSLPYNIGASLSDVRIDEALLEAGKFAELDERSACFLRLKVNSREVRDLASASQPTIAIPFELPSAAAEVQEERAAISHTASSLAPVLAHPQPDAHAEERRFASANATHVPERRKAPASLSDLEPPRAAVQRSKRIVQVAGVLGPLGGEPADHIRQARLTILNWAMERGAAVPDKAFKGLAFDRDLTQTNHPITVEATNGCWGMQFDTRSSPETIWRTEVVLLETRERAQVGISLTVIDSRGTEGIRHSSIPVVIRRLATGVGLYDDGRLLDATPMPTATMADIDRLVALIESPKRTRAIVAIAQDGSGRQLYSPAQLASRLAGVAHVVDMDTEACWQLTHRYGKSLSVYGLAIRVYRPLFDADVDAPTRHPLFVGERWLERATVLETRLSEISAEETTKGGHEVVPTFTSVRRHIANKNLEEARRSATSQLEQLTLLAHENARLVRECAISDELWVAADIERASALALCEEHKEVARKWRVRADWLESWIRGLKEHESSPTTEVALPDCWDGMEDWADEVLGARVCILRPALRSARKSVFNDIPLVYAALKMLGECYQPMRASRTEATRDTYLKELARLRLEIADVGEALTNHHHEPHYRAMWLGRPITLNLHVSGSSSRLQQKGFRLYFYYDEQEDIVVVGHFPTHLPSSLS